MSLPANENGPNGLSGAPGLSESHKTLVEPDEEEEEDDVDFNPFSKESPSAEASSSLSSEVDGWDANAESDGENSLHISSMQSADTKTCSVSSSGDYTRMILRTKNSDVAQGREIKETFIRNSKRRKWVTVSDPENVDIGEKETGLGNVTDVINDALETDVNATSSRKCITDIDDEDAICKRTRARYSLASFTLDELENFLQETDDEDDVQNVDEEGEYRKFLAAVLQGGDGADPATLDNGDDEDEDNDADFELEIEEALESDPEDCLVVSEQKDKGLGRCPETRRNKCQKVSLQDDNLPGQTERTLRPLLPILPNVPIVSCPGINNRNMIPDAPQFLPSRHNSVVNGFTPQQIGQLYCLIHEHVQLLVQVYSLCVLEPSRQHIASQVQGFLEDMIGKRDQVLTWRHLPYPSICFGTPYAHPSASHENIAGASQTTDDHRVLSSTIDRLQGPPPCDRRCEPASTGLVNSVQVSQQYDWLPSADGDVLSVLDVAPLKLVGRYIDDVSTAVREHQRSYVESTSSVSLIKEPLFPLPAPPFASQVHNVREATNLLESNVVPSSSPNQKPPKKSLAATLVENTKKQSVALVPKEIAKLAQQFYPLFNPSLFPHKPPPSSVAKRVLFTDAEDELLALGIMEYNNDWKAIQQRFLPCKSKHQIFVRQKNRCSAKAPENPIKAVRRMKTSPLNPDEIARIHEGLKVFKLDWMSIWKFIVPHRDISLLPRQWRIALGTQKSYKMDSAKKESRRIYESKRRRKIAALGSSVVASQEEGEIDGENDSREDHLDNENGAYVHEAFLSDWRPDSGDQTNQDSRPVRGPSHDFPYASEVCRKPDSNLVPNGFSESSNGVPNYPLSLSTPKPSKYRARRAKSSHLIRLAPDLPPVNLPPSVRVISHASFRSSQNGGSTVIAPARCSTSCAGMGTAVPGPSTSPRPLFNASETITNSDITLLCSQDSGPQKNKCVSEEKGTTSDLQMHPLLFQTPNHGSLPYCPITCSNSPSAFSFFPPSSNQVNLSPFQNPHTGGLSIAGSYKTFEPLEDVSPSGLDFHPLLRRTDDFNSYIIAGSPTAQVSVRDAEAETLAHATGQIDAQPASGAGTSSPRSNRNDINLEFNLSSAPVEEKISSNNQAEVLVLSNNSSDCNRIDVSTHSMPEIVMEQEELSDSDDEIEHVEFECEEMADSEGDEGSGCDANEQEELNQGQPDHAVGTSPHVSESAAYEDPEGISAQSKATSSHTLDLSGPGKDSATSPWLSLSSHGRF